MKNLVIFCAFFGLHCMHAQITADEKLAIQFTQNKDFIKAKPLWESLWNDNKKAYYNAFLLNLVELQNYSLAETVIAKTQKKDKENNQYVIDNLWIGYLATNNKEPILNYIANIEKTELAFKQTLTFFEARKLTVAMVPILERAEFVFGETAFFGTKLTQYYLNQGQRETAIRRIILQLDNPFIPFDQAKNLIEMNVSDSASLLELRNILLEEINKKPDSEPLNDLLNWVFVQLQDWKTAFIFTKSIENRMQSNGQKLFLLGNLCMENTEYKTAIDCFNEIETNVNFSLFANYSIPLSIKCAYSLLVLNDDTQQVQPLLNRIQTNLPLTADPKSIFELIRIQSNLNLIYLNNPEEAKHILETFLQNPSTDASTKAKAKLDLANVLIILNDVWLSELLYAQVEKDFGENPIGQEAKFLRAQLSYYRGDFTWSNTQLNVLKEATTQVISNNAIALSLLITENLGLDSNYDALERFAQAQLYTTQKNYAPALVQLDSIVKLYPGHSLSDNILFEKATIAEKQKQYTLAATLYNQLTIAFSRDILADDAHYRLGLLYLQKLNNPEEAFKSFEKIILNFSGSLYQIDARKYYRTLRGDKV